ncbi:hypothetical protein BDV59DRAFT_179218 [Aspergillus ambiguus]|uniref:uncharacterized protein n=1 Tax=Aspergillus ambiguus TaxID=176160 RepID=UPI003CCDCEC9
MLLSSFTISALFLGKFTFSAENSVSYSSPILSSTQYHTLNIPCRPCAFSLSNCSDSMRDSASLTITFRTKDDTLLANSDIIFPAFAPLNFYAQYYRGSSSENVSVPYIMHLKALFHQPSSVLGRLYRLELALVDLHGHLATESPVSVSFLHKDNGKLEIIGINESQYKRYPHHLSQDPNTAGSRWPKKTKNSDNFAFVIQALKAPWAGNKEFLRLVQPAIMPALLGVAAAVLAFLMGFLIGKIISELYYCCCGGKISLADGPESDVENAMAFEK